MSNSNIELLALHGCFARMEAVPFVKLTTVTDDDDQWAGSAASCRVWCSGTNAI